MNIELNGMIFTFHSLNYYMDNLIKLFFINNLIVTIEGGFCLWVILFYKLTINDSIWNIERYQLKYKILDKFNIIFNKR